MLREGTGVELVSAIQEAPRAVVFISVPWSVPERNGREIFRTAAGILDERHSKLGIALFRLEVDEDEISQKWLVSVGYPQFADMGVGSLLWLQSGQVLATEMNALTLNVSGIVGRSILLWGHGP